MVKAKISKVRIGGKRRKTRKARGGNARECRLGTINIWWPIEDESLKKGDEVYITGEAGEIGIFIVKEIIPLTGFSQDLSRVGVNLVKKNDPNISIFLHSGDLIHQKRRICKLGQPPFKGGGGRKKNKRGILNVRKTRRIRRRCRRRRRLRR